jgi:hypothetical protein
MKKVLHFSLFLIVLSASTCAFVQAQVIFSRFDFNATPFTTAAIGPDALGIDADAVGDGSAIYIAGNCGGTKGFDMTIPNTAGIFDKPEMGMTFRFRKLESRSDFFVRGGTRFYQTGHVLYVSYRTSDGAAGFADYGPFDCGYTLAEDNLYHEYTFIYTEATGLAIVTVDGLLVWSNDGPDNRAFYWVGDPDPVVGTVMDGNCNGVGILDYAYFFTPDVPLPVEFLTFEARAQGSDAQLDWVAANANTQQPYTIERSKNGMDFVTIAEMQPSVGHSAQAQTYTDQSPGNGTFFYRIRQQDVDGRYSSTDVQEVTLSGKPIVSMQLWPNPINAATSESGAVNVTLENVGVGAQLMLVNLQGSVVAQTKSEAAHTQLDISQVAPGLYLLKCDCDGAQLVQKLIVR